MGNCEKAMEWYESALAGYKKALGPHHESTIRTANSIARLLKFQRDCAWRQRASADYGPSGFNSFVLKLSKLLFQ